MINWFQIKWSTVTVYNTCNNCDTIYHHSWNKLYVLYFNLCSLIIILMQFLSESFLARTRFTHADQCSRLGGILHDHFSTTYGLHRDSSLNSLQYFHITEGLIPDIMHDCLEGCVQYETKELLKYICSERILTISSINNLIQSFPFLEPDATNRPAPITATTLASADHCLKQTGECACL